MSGETRVVVVYERVSTDKQDMARQAIQQEYARRDHPDSEVMVIPDDGVSAFTASIFDRPGGAKLMALIVAGRVAAVYTDAQDRLGRFGEHEWTSFCEVLRLAGTKLVIDGQEVQDDFGGRLGGVVKAMIARQESVEKSHRVKGGILLAAQAGRYCGSVPPYGYRFDGERKARRLVVIDAEAGVVRRIFRESIGGGSIRSIALALNEDGIPGPGGGAWGPSVISKLLRKMLYLGIIELHGEEYAGQHDPIIDAGTWDTARRLRESRSTHTESGRGRNPSATHLLTRGILKCRCGESMVPRTWKNPAGVKFEHYVCSQRIYYGKDSCPQPGIEREEIDSAILHYFETVALDLDATRAQRRDAHDARLSESRSLRDAAERDAMRLTGDLAKIERDYLAGDLAAAAYSDLRERYGATSAAANSEAERLAQRAAEVESETSLDQADADLIGRLTEIRAAVAGEVAPNGDLLAVRAALSSLFVRFDLRRLWTPEAPDVAHLDLCIPGDLVIVPTLREDVIERYEQTTGERVIDVPKPRHVPLNLAENIVSTGTVPNWSQRIGAVAAPHAVDTASASRSHSGNGYPSSARRRLGTSRKIEPTAANESWKPGSNRHAGVQASRTAAPSARKCHRSRGRASSHASDASPPAIPARTTDGCHPTART